MPPAPPTKFARTSIEGWSRKRSVSPTAAAQSSSSKKIIASSLQPSPELISGSAAPSEPRFTPKRSDDGYYYEDEYRDEHIAHMLDIEGQTLAQPELMDQQPELQWRMRPYLIDFMVEIHQQFRLRPEVLYLAVNIVDRYVSRRVVYKKHYQLVGCASLWIAAKYEDSKDRVPLVREFYDMCCGAYEQSAFIQMEGHILTTIQWTIGHTTCEAWLRSYLMSPEAALTEEPRVQAMARFLMEVTLFHREFVGVRSHVLAWGALLLARFICGKLRKAAPDFITSQNDSSATRVAEAIDRVFSSNIDNVSEILIRKYASQAHSRCSTTVREFYNAGRRYASYPEPPSTPYSTLPTPGLTPSSWTCKRASPGGSFSCSSSDAGDEPITPITPILPHASVVNAGADYVSAKENIAPSGAAPHATGKAMPPPSAYQPRPALHSIPSSLAIPQRTMRRLSN